MVATTGIITCCSANKMQVYRFLTSVDYDNCNFLEMMEKLSEIDRDPKYIILKNDSILEYWKLFGGLGTLTTVKYYLKDNLITIDSLDIYGKPCPEELTNIELVYFRDSLINKKTDERYYNQKYIDKMKFK